MIVAENLTKKFDDFLAVDHVNLKTNEGQVLAMLGPNGAGKTTTVRMLTSILNPTNGRASVAGYDVVREAARVRASVGVLTEHHGLYNRMKPIEYLEFYGNLYGLDKTTTRQRITYLLDEFGLENSTRKRLGEFSKGMRQKLAMTRAMLHDPPVLLLDEPTSAMDPESARMVRDSILRLKSNHRTILICTHNLAEAEELADQIAIIHNGKILHNDSPENIKLKLLGPTRYEAHLAELPGQNEWQQLLPPGVKLHSIDGKVLTFDIHEPLTANPEILRILIQQSLQIVSFHKVPRSLEQAYLQAVQAENGNNRHV